MRFGLAGMVVLTVVLLLLFPLAGRHGGEDQALKRPRRHGCRRHAIRHDHLN